MYSWESEQRVFWIMYPDSCGPVERQLDGSWDNLRLCNDADTFFMVSIEEAPPDPSSADANIALLTDYLAADLRTNPVYSGVLRSQIQTNQGRTLEIIRSTLGAGAATEVKSVSGFYLHPDTGALFTIVMLYPVIKKPQNAAKADFALKSFTVLR